MDNVCKKWVTKCKGMETVLHTSKLSTPIKEAGMGPYQLFWSFRMRYVTVMQRLLRDPTSGCNPWGEAPAPRSFNPMYYYWSVTKQLGAVTGMTCTEIACGHRRQ